MTVRKNVPKAATACRRSLVILGSFDDSDKLRNLSAWLRSNAYSDFTRSDPPVESHWGNIKHELKIGKYAVDFSDEDDSEQFWCSRIFDILRHYEQLAELLAGRGLSRRTRERSFRQLSKRLRRAKTPEIAAQVLVSTNWSILTSALINCEIPSAKAHPKFSWSDRRQDISWLSKHPNSIAKLSRTALRLANEAAREIPGTRGPKHKAALRWVIRELIAVHRDISKGRAGYRVITRFVWACLAPLPTRFPVNADVLRNEVKSELSVLQKSGPR